MRGSRARPGFRRAGRSVMVNELLLGSGVINDETRTAPSSRSVPAGAVSAAAPVHRLLGDVHIPDDLGRHIADHHLHFDSDLVQRAQAAAALRA